jgi:hypothetical protein
MGEGPVMGATINPGRFVLRIRVTFQAGIHTRSAGATWIRSSTV